VKPSKITMVDVARAAGVSPMTVSNTYKYPERVQEQTRIRVLERAAELGYVPNIAAGSLAAGESRVIGATIPSMRNSSFYRYVLGMQRCANAGGYKLVLMLAETIEQESTAIAALVGLRVAGLVLVGTEHASDSVRLLERAGIPVVESWTLGGAMDMGAGYDAAAATRELVRLLLKDGRRRRISLIVHDRGASRRFLDRIPAFQRELAEAGLKADLVHYASETDDFGAGPRALESLLLRAPDLDAVICPTDIVAAGILFECSRRGISVPEQLAVVGWGDYELSREVTPQLTTLRPNAGEMGAAAVELLIKRAQGTVPRGCSIDTGFEIVERSSTCQRP
jgi:LacI family transcriptional regulator, gluconate utilization system Gnt-I transcriptional repressor